MLGDLENPIPDTIVPATFEAMVVVTVKGMIAEIVLGKVTRVGAAVPSFHEREAETVAHRRPEGPRVHVEGKRRGWEGVQPIAGVRKSEGVQACLVPDGGRREKE